MADNSHIEWTDATWNPIAGCSVVSPGCTNCYAMRSSAPRLNANPATPHYHGTVQPSKAGPVWTGKIGIAPDRVLTQPLRWKRPRRIFVNSTSDLFHEGVPDAAIDRIFAVMALCPQHTFQVLTKRPERMRAYLTAESDGLGDRGGSGPRFSARERVLLEIGSTRGAEALRGFKWPLPNVWLGTSVEDQTRADERIPHLLATPAAVRFISAEPLLGPIDLRQWLYDWGCGCGWGGDNTLDHCPNCGWVGEGPTIDGAIPGDCPACTSELSDYYACPECHGTGQDGSGFGPNSLPRLDWVIVGGESGRGARPMHPDWARSLRDQCAAAGVPFFFKQQGEWAPRPELAHLKDLDPDMTWQRVASERADVRPSFMVRVGKRAAGRLLDGIEHNAMPGRI